MMTSKAVGTADTHGSHSSELLRLTDLNPFILSVLKHLVHTRSAEYHACKAGGDRTKENAIVHGIYATLLQSCSLRNNSNLLTHFPSEERFSVLIRSSLEFSQQLLGGASKTEPVTLAEPKEKENVGSHAGNKPSEKDSVESTATPGQKQDQEAQHSDQKSEDKAFTADASKAIPCEDTSSKDVKMPSHATPTGKDIPNSNALLQATLLANNRANALAGNSYLSLARVRENLINRNREAIVMQRIAMVQREALIRQQAILKREAVLYREAMLRQEVAALNQRVQTTSIQNMTDKDLVILAELYPALNVQITRELQRRVESRALLLNQQQMRQHALHSLQLENLRAASLSRMPVTVGGRTQSPLEMDPDALSTIQSTAPRANNPQEDEELDSTNTNAIDSNNTARRNRKRLLPLSSSREKVASTKTDPSNTGSRKSTKKGGKRTKSLLGKDRPQTKRKKYKCKKGEKANLSSVPIVTSKASKQKKSVPPNYPTQNQKEEKTSAGTTNGSDRDSKSGLEQEKSTPSVSPDTKSEVPSVTKNDVLDETVKKKLPVSVQRALARLAPYNDPGRDTNGDNAFILQNALAPNSSSSSSRGTRLLRRRRSR